MHGHPEGGLTDKLLRCLSQACPPCELGPSSLTCNAGATSAVTRALGRLHEVVPQSPSVGASGWPLRTRPPTRASRGSCGSGSSSSPRRGSGRPRPRGCAGHADWELGP